MSWMSRQKSSLTCAVLKRVVQMFSMLMTGDRGMFSMIVKGGRGMLSMIMKGGRGMSDT